MNRNQKTMKLEITRLELCELKLACSFAYAESGAEKWQKLHEKLKEQLDAFDEQYDEMMFEMRAAFGEGETVVNVLTGEKYYL